MRTRTVGLLLFPGFEPIDAFGPVEAFVLARFPDQGDDAPPDPFRVVTIAQDAQAVAMTGGQRVVPDCVWTACPAPDVLLVPGGAGTGRAYQNAALLDFLRAQASPGARSWPRSAPGPPCWPPRVCSTGFRPRPTAARSRGSPAWAPPRIGTGRPTGWTPAR